MHLNGNAFEFDPMSAWSKGSRVQILIVPKFLPVFSILFSISLSLSFPLPFSKVSKTTNTSNLKKWILYLQKYSAYKIPVGLPRTNVWPFCFTMRCFWDAKTKKQERPLRQQKTPPANKLHVTSRLMSNNTRKYIFPEYSSSIIQYLNDLEFTFQGHSRSNLLVPLDSPYVVSY